MFAIWGEGDELDRDLDAEISAHIDEAIEELVRQGLPPIEARRAALSRFGGITQTRDAHREVRSFRWMSDLLRDCRYAVRSFRRAPGFSTVAILTLALGIGATTAMFSVVYGVLLKPLPFRDADRLVALYHVTPASRTDAQGAATYFTYREQARVFEDIGLWNLGNVSVTRDGTPEQVQVLRVTDGTLSLLGVRAEVGRPIGKEDDGPDAPLRVVLTHAYWQQAFGGSPGVIGQTLIIDGKPHEIIGVLPTSFRLRNTAPEVVLPLRLDRSSTRTGALPFNGIARLKPGVTLAQANADIARMIPRVADEFPLMRGLTRQMWDAVGLAPNVRPLSEDVIGEMGRPLWILLGTVGIVLLMAWTNVANLPLVRAEGRRKEFAVRRALGAGRWRLAVELLSESLMLGLTGSALGILVATAAVGLLRTTAPVALPRVDDIGINGIVLLVALGTSVVTSLLFGLIPALRFHGVDVEILKEAGRSTTAAPGRHRLRNTLVISQIALALVLLIVSGLMARTFIAMRQVQPGFVRPGEVQTFNIALPAARIRDQEQVTRAFEQIADHLTRVPGVVAVGLAGSVRDGRHRGQGADLCRRTSCFKPAADALGQSARRRILRRHGQPGPRRSSDHVDRHFPIQVRGGDFGQFGARILGTSSARGGPADCHVSWRALAGDRRRGRRRACRRLESPRATARLFPDGGQAGSQPGHDLRRAIVPRGQR